MSRSYEINLVPVAISELKVGEHFTEDIDFPCFRKIVRLDLDDNHVHSRPAEWVGKGVSPIDYVKSGTMVYRVTLGEE